MHNSRLMREKKERTVYTLSANDAKPTIDPAADQLASVLII